MFLSYVSINTLMGVHMISQSNLPVVEVLRHFKTADIPVTFLVPTKTGMEKSIMDATAEIRTFLQSSGLHDYDSQQQGPDHRVYIPVKILSRDIVHETKCSLYRPNTKKGDPRIWIYDLKDHAQPTDLLALVVANRQLLVINCSKSVLETILDSTNKTYRQLFSASVIKSSPAAEELLQKLKSIHKMGFVTTKRPGDTGVGYTLETLLGISANSSKAPDYKGIEIKSKRQRTERSGRATIFSQVPNWKKSKLKSSKELLYKRGKFSDKKQRIQLFHELSVIKPNSYDLQLGLDSPNDQLQQLYVAKIPPVVDTVWDFDTLKERVKTKHKETFWVTAKTQGKSGDINEKYCYSNIKHTGSVDETAFSILLELGVITLDYTIKEKSPGVAKDQGYLFKISTKNLDLLFNRVDEYDLSM